MNSTLSSTEQKIMDWVNRGGPRTEEEKKMLEWLGRGKQKQKKSKGKPSQRGVDSFKLLLVRNLYEEGVLYRSKDILKSLHIDTTTVRRCLEKMEKEKISTTRDISLEVDHTHVRCYKCNCEIYCICLVESTGRIKDNLCLGRKEYPKSMLNGSCEYIHICSKKCTRTNTDMLEYRAKYPNRTFTATENADGNMTIEIQ